MHSAAKWTLIAGAASMALGILLMVIGGSMAPDESEVDPKEDIVFSGQSGELSVTPWNYLSVFAEGDSCDGISLSVLHDGEAYPYFYDFCSGGESGYYSPAGWIHIADIAPIDDEDFQDGEMVLDISANVDVSIIKDPTGDSIAAAGFGVAGCCLGILVLLVGLVLWAVLDDPAPTMTYAPQTYGQAGMMVAPGTYGAQGMVQTPVQDMPNAAGILPAQPVQQGMAAVVPGTVMGAYAVPVVPQGTTVVQAPVQQMQPAGMNMSAPVAASPPVQPTPQPTAPVEPTAVPAPATESQPATEALEDQGTFWQKPPAEDQPNNVGDEFMS